MAGEAEGRGFDAGFDAGMAGAGDDVYALQQQSPSSSIHAVLATDAGEAGDRTSSSRARQAGLPALNGMDAGKTARSGVRELARLKVDCLCYYRYWLPGESWRGPSAQSAARAGCCIGAGVAPRRPAEACPPRPRPAAGHQ